MKVNIGSYKDKPSVHNIECLYLRWRYANKNKNKRKEEGDYLELEEQDFTKFDHAVVSALDWIQTWVLDYIVNPVFYDPNRKIKVRIDPSDTWNMDSTLSWIILPMLRQLRDTKHGSPHVDDADVPEYLHPPKEYDASNHGTDDNWHLRWDWVLEEMIWAFEQTTQGMDTEDVDTNEQELHNIEQRWQRVDPDIDADENFHHARIRNGQTLFGKYYQHLWD